jgi:hypothetical protein
MELRSHQKCYLDLSLIPLASLEIMRPKLIYQSEIDRAEEIE